MRPTVKLWEIATILNWRAYSQNELLEKWKYPVLRVWNFFTNSNWYYSDLELEDDKYCNKWDLLYAWSASFWPKIWEWWKTIYHYHIWKIKLSEKIDKNYLYHYLFWDSQAIKQHWHWVAMMHITKWDMEKKEIPLPPLETQKAIVAKLDQIFAELDQTKSEIQKNLDNTDELWKSALNQAFQGNWEMKKLGEVCDFVRWPFGWSLKKEIFVKEWYAVYEQQHAIYNQFSDFRYFINDEKFLEMKRFEVYPWDLIMSCSWTMGKVSIVPKNSPKWIINQALLKITPSKLINAEFLKNWMDSKDFQDQIWANTQWAAIQNVASVKVISTLNIPVPPLSEQERIVEHLDQVSKEVKALKSQYQSQLDNLEELKKSVLDKAFRWEM